MLNDVSTDAEDNEDPDEEPAAKKTKTAAVHLDEEEEALATGLNTGSHFDDQGQEDGDDYDDSNLNNGEEEDSRAQDGEDSDGAAQEGDEDDFFATNGVRVFSL